MVDNCLNSTIRKENMVFTFSVIPISIFRMAKVQRTTMATISTSWRMGVINGICVLVHWWGMSMVRGMVRSMVRGWEMIGQGRCQITGQKC